MKKLDINEMKTIKIEELTIKMVHHTQKARKRNLDLISGWIGKTPTEKINRPKLLRKIMLVLGASKYTAKEYIEVVLGEEAAE